MGARRDEFEQDGFLRVEGFLAADEVALVNAELDRYAATIVPGVTENVFFEGEPRPENLLQVRYLERATPFFAAYLDDPRFRAVAEELLGEPAAPQQMHYFTKPARTGGATPPHQDGYYFMLAEPLPAVTMWVALESVDEVNGCLHYALGSHRLPMRTHATTRRVGFSQGMPDYPTDGGRAVPASPGDLLIHHAKTVHWAPANRSNRTRRAFGCVYYGRSAQLDEEARAAYRERVAWEAGQ